MNAYACYNNDMNVRINSSSGGVFSLLAEEVLADGGVVYGVAMAADCYSAEYISVTNQSELHRLVGSKYMQAKMGDIFRNVQRNLIDGKSVLFTGTGCQVNGLRNYLGHEYDNLLCVDVICHGVPSPALWEKYAKHQEHLKSGKLIRINFRCKKKGWVDFCMEETLISDLDGTIKTEYSPKNTDPYMQMFLRDYCLRPSCYRCMAKGEKHADITIADFWGIDKVVPPLNDNNGISLVLVRTAKGEDCLNRIKDRMQIQEVSYEEAVKYNHAEYQSPAKPVQRETFFKDMNIMSFTELADKYIVPLENTSLLKVRIKNKLRKYMRALFSK